MSKESKDIKSIFLEALEKKTAEERKDYLDRVCGNDANLRAEFESLLKAHGGAGDFLESLAMERGGTFEDAPFLEGPGTKIGRYELLELIGEGGMGLVYLAEQREPVKRRVALKIIKPGMDSKEVIARFEAERQALALLDHPNIAHVFDAGTTDKGRPYFVMEYVKGMSITRYCDERRLDIEQRLRLFQEVCEGVHHAHQKGIIHRDIKPSNILISIHGDRAVPKIIDFGIAKAAASTLTERTMFTFQGQLLGTPEYMSPEQVDLATQDIDTRSDIYSLGVVLYELLAGVLPFERESLQKIGFAELQHTLREVEPASPSIRLSNLGKQAKAIADSRMTQVVPLARRLHRELEWIPLKAMRKDRCRRYKSASDMADDIQSYLNGNPLLAGPETAIYRIQKFVHKHAGSVTTAALVSVAIIIGLVASIILGCRAEQARQQETSARKQVEQALIRAEKAEEVAQEQADKYRNLSYLHSVALADAKYREGNLRNARQLLKSCPENLRGWEWHRLNYVMDESLMTFGHGGEGALAIAFSPDGKRIATAYVTITIWNATTGAEMQTLKGHKAAVLSLAFSPDGERIISGSMDKSIKVWNMNSGEEIMTLEGHKAAKGVADVDLSIDGKRVVSIDYDGIIKAWEADTGEELLTIKTPLRKGEYGRSIALSPDGKRILAGSRSKEVYEWDAATGEQLRTFRMQDQSVLFVEYSPDGRQIAMGCAKGMIKIVDTETEKETILTEGKGWDQSLVTSLAFSLDSKLLVTGGYDRMVRLWDTNTGRELTTLIGHPASLTDVVFSPDGRLIASTALGGQSRVWNPSEEREGRILKRGHTNLVRALAFSPDSKQLISASMDKAIKVWDVSKGKVIHTLSGHENSIWSLAISPDGRHIVSGSEDSTIRLWDIDSGEQLERLKGHAGAVYSVAFSPDNKCIVSGGTDKQIRVWDVSTGEELKTFSGHKENVYSVGYSPDGRHIVSGSSGVIKIWDAETGEELRTLSGHRYSVRSISFTPNGKRIISGGYDATVRIWDTDTGDEVMTLFGHNKNIESIALSPDGKRIISGSFISAKVWDANTGAELMTLPSNEALAVAFSPDGRTIAGSDGNDIILWESDSRQEENGSVQGKYPQEVLN
ncbi:MAG: protein kinase [Sedimentisphaerales bacterium]|nr:protein kinase [Sedimentisphaerales bacterium]